MLFPRPLRGISGRVSTLVPFSTLLVAAITLTVSAAGRAHAGTYTYTFTSFDSAIYAGSPVNYTIGTYAFAIPTGETVVSASLIGKTGNANANSTAPLNLMLDNVLVKQTTASSPDYNTGQAFSYVFTPGQFGIFADGSVTLNVTHTGDFYVRLSPTTLTFQTAPSAVTAAPEPGAVVTGLSMVGMTGLGLVRGRVRRRAIK